MQIELKGVARAKPADSAKASLASGSELQPPSPALLHGFVKTVKPQSGGTIR